MVMLELLPWSIEVSEGLASVTAELRGPAELTAAVMLVVEGPAFPEKANKVSFSLFAR